MKYFKLDLLTLLIGLFLFSSCKKDGTIGLDTGSDNLINSVFTDTVTINTITVRDDSTITSSNYPGVFQNAFGFINDPILGNTQANLALGLTLPSEGYTFGNSPTLDSAVLVLKYGNKFYGDSLSTYQINVHQLAESQPFFPIVYYNNSIFNREASIIGSYSTSNVKWKDSVSINTIVKNGPDKITKVDPHIRIPLSASFINEKFINASTNTLKSNTAFNTALRGFYVTVSQTTGTGGIIFIDAVSPTTKLDIYYKTQTGTVKDTLLASFKATAASEIKHTISTTVQTQLTAPNPSTSFGTVYVQPLGGLRTKIRFPHLAKLKENGNVSVNKAELVIPVLESTDAFPFKPAPRLALYRSDIAGQRQSVPDNNFTTFGGIYNATDKTYTFNITSYIQEILSNKSVQYDTFIAPIEVPATTQPNIFSSGTTAARAVIGGGNHPTNRMKLKLTYTKPN
ncbi:MAG TPA: DUF4270 domain-containing protein [Pedobacter sp.]|jgi:hypothetical protein